MGLRFNERMQGVNTFIDGPRAGELQPISIQLEMRTPAASQFWNPLGDAFWRLDTSGWLRAPGVAERVRVAGTLTLRYLTRRNIVYDVTFTGDDGRNYRFRGEKRNIWPWNAWRTHFELFAEIRPDGGPPVSEATMRFSYRDMLPFLRAFHHA